MRIIAGTLRGRHFDAPKGHKTHPMSDKMRGALFNALGDIEGLTVLDAFGGSGALSFEAVSRGATAVVIESDANAQKIITRNIAELHIGNRVKLIKASANAWLSTNKQATFDLVLCDPPYEDLQLNLIKELAQCAAPGGLLVLSWPGSQALPEFAGLERAKQHSYGDGQLCFYRRQAASENATA